MFFRLSSLELGLILFGIVLGSTLLGSFVGHRLRGHADTLREPFGVVQAALLGLVALILAFGLTMAVGRYDSRRAAVVADANAIGTTYLRAQTLRAADADALSRGARALHGHEHRSLSRCSGKRCVSHGDRGRRARAARAVEAQQATPWPTRRSTAPRASMSRP